MFKFNKYYLFIIFILLGTAAFSQSTISPDGILFQAVARDANGNAAVSRNVYAKVSIIKGTATGAVEYSESFQVTSSAEGIFTIVIGKGTRTAGVSGLAAIDWGGSIHYLNLKVAIEPTFPDPNWTPTNEYIDLGTSQFWSVPYTLFASKSSYADSTATITNILPGEKGGTGINNKGKTITLGNNIITKGIGDLTITTTAASNIIFPTSGTLSTITGKDTLLNKTLVSPVLNGRPIAVTPDSTSADSSIATTLFVNKQINKLSTSTVAAASGKLNIADTAAMLLPYATVSGAQDLTNKTINGIRPTSLATGFSISGGTSTRTTVTVVGDVTIGGVNSGDQLITLTGDVSGSGTGLFPTTVNSIGGISSTTIATLPTRVTANETNIAANTANIATNTANITTNSNNITANTNAINALDTRVTTNSSDIALRATIASPNFTGIPTAPTASLLNNSNQIATTAFVSSLITAATPDADAVTKGKLQLIGDLGGTAASPLVNKIGGKTISLGGNLLTAGNITTTGNYSTTINAVGNTNINLPTSGTLSTLNGNESLTNKIINGVTPTALATGFTIAGGTSTNTTLTVVGDVTVGGVNSGDQLITLVGDVTGSGTATFTTTIANGTINNNKIAAGANITDSKLATISTAGKVLNSATSATFSNTANSIVARDANGNFNAGIITAALAGNASTTTALQTPRIIYGNLFDGTANLTQVIAPNFGGTGVNNASKTITLGGNINTGGAITTGGVFTTANDFIVAGNYSTTLNITSATNLTLPTNGTLATLNGVETFTNKTLTSPIINAPTGLVKSDVGLSNVDNTTDLGKPISTATQLALNLKANTASPTFTGTVSGITKDMVGLGNVDNTSDLNKPISTATQNALDLKQNILNQKADIASPTFTGTVSGITKDMIGLANVDNTSDLNKPISTATQAALDLKEALANKSLDITTDATSDTKYPSVKSVKTYVDNTVLNNRAGDATTTSKGIIQLAGDLGGTAAAPLVNKIGGKSVTLGGSLSTDGYFATSGNFSTTLIATGNTSLTLPLTGTLATLAGTESLTNKTINGVTPTALATGFTIAGGTSTNTTLTVIGDVTVGGVNSGDQLITLTNDVSGSGTGTFPTTINSVGGVSSTTIATLPTRVASNTASITANTNAIASNTSSITSLQTSVAANTASITTNTADITLRATIASPSFTGTPTAPTATVGTNTTQVATTEFVLASITNTLTPDADANTKGKLKLTGDLGGTASSPIVNSVGGVSSATISTLPTLVVSHTASITSLQTNVAANTASITSNTNAIAANTSSITTLQTNVASNTTSITSLQTNVASNTASITSNTNSIASNTSSITSLQTNVTANTLSITSNTNAIASNTASITANSAAIMLNTNNIAANTTSITANTNAIASNTISITSLENRVAANTASITVNANNIALRATIESPSFTGTPTALTAPVGTNTTQLATTAFVLSSITNSVTPDADATTKGKIQLSNDLGGTAAAPTVNSVGGVSSSTIATLPTSIASQTASITALQTIVASNTSSITSLQTNVASNTASITANTSSIATNTANIISNTNNITALQTSVASNTASITANTNSIASNTASITANTASIATNTANIASNTTNITTNTNNIASNTASITSLQTSVTGNTASITTNTADIALRATIASPSFTGTPTAPTAAAGTSTNQIATTAFVSSVVGGSATPDADATTKGKIQLANDLGGTAAAPTVNSVGGVSSSTIATLPTSIASHTSSITSLQTSVASNTASITANTNSIATNAANIATNTANITTNTTNITTNTNNIASNTSSITALQTSVASNTSSITSLQTSVNANTVSITTNAANIATNTTNITTNTNNIASNTSSITTLQTNVASNTANITINTNNISSNTSSITSLQSSVAVNTASITALDTRVTANTASITANSNAIALRATISSPSFTGTPTAPTPQDGTNDTQIATTAFVQNIVSSSVQTGISASATPDATASTKGKIKLTNDLGGTADLPTVNSVGGVSSSTISNLPADIALRATIASPSFTGTPTAPTAAPGTSTNQIATTAYVASVVGGSATPDADAITKGKIQLANDLGGTAAAPTVNSVGGVSSSTIATLPTSINANTASITANTASIATNASNIASNTTNITSNTNNIASNTASITSLQTSVTANTASITTNTADIALRATIASPSFTGTPTAPTAAAGTSTNQIATTAFVSSVVGGSATPDADATTKGKIQLANDLGGTAAAPTVNSVGGVSSSTIATLPTSIASHTSSITSLQTSVASNTASITANTNSIATNAANIATNTANITTNTTNITTNTNNIASNTSSITALQTSVASNTSSITSLQTSVNANTVSITTNSANIATNTTNITTNTNNIASNTSSITSLETRVTANTASITINATNIATNTSDIALRATIASPSFTGTPTAPTAAAGTSTTQIATTAFVSSLVGGSATPDADATTKGKIQLANDLGGTATAPTVNSVGGVSSSTIATLNTSITAATSSNTTSTIVKRDANGDFAAGMITANLTGAVTGNASTATKLATARNIFGNTFDGSSDITGQLSPAYGGTGVNNGSNTLTLGGSLTTVGSDALSLTISGTTSLTLPNSGTISTLEGTESITGLKTFGDQKLAIKGAGAGSIILSSSNTTGSNYTLTLPSLTATIATLSGTESLTNKTIVSPVIYNPTGIVSSDVGLGNVNNTSDADKPVSTLQQAALDLKEALANKSINVTTDAASDTKYPSVKAVKTYVDAQVASTTVNDATTSVKGIIKLGGDLAGTGTSAAAPVITDAAITTAKLATDAVTTIKILDGAIATAKLADGAVTNAKITSMSATKLTGIVSSSNGGAGTLNGVLQADGNGNVSVASAGTVYATPAQVASNYLPLSGGTLTGALNGTTANFSGALTAGGITFPSSDGTAGQLLVTNGSGTLTWSSGALSVGAIAGSSNAKGAVISSNVLSLTPADATNGGIITTAAQTFAGAKTFSSTTTIADVTDATSTTDGALIVSGGASIAKNLFVGGLTASKAVFTDANKGLTSSGTLGITQGGTGATTKVTGFDALSPMTTAGDLIYGGTSGSGTRLGVGAANTILRSNGSAPIWGAVTLTTDVTGILPIANGGTGSATQNFVDLTTAQTIAGSKTFSGTTTMNGALTVSGTNVFTAGGTTYPTATGTAGQVLTISSAGAATWTSTSSSATVRDVVDETTVGAQTGTMSATTASQTNFTISQVPSSNSKVKMFINGIRISNAAYSFYTSSAFTTISATPTIYIKYDATKNGSYNISANDRVQFDYFY